MSARRHLSFGSTNTWIKFYKEVKHNTDKSGRHAYAGFDPSLGIPPTEEQIELLKSYEPKMPTLTLLGTEKLHGENIAVCYSQGELWVQGRNHIRTLLGDQNGMAAFVESTKTIWLHIFDLLSGNAAIDTQTNTIVIDCEWAGGNIQKGNAACSGTPKGAYIFDHFRVVNNEDNSETLHSTAKLYSYPDESIYLMSSFGVYTLTLDLNYPEKCEKELDELTKEIEDNSPIAKFHDKPDNVGEGVYLYTHHEGITYRLKSKGFKHGGKPKVRKDNGISDETKAMLSDVAHKVTPEWRINQAITETNSTEIKHIGEVIKWVNQDIVKEEMEVINEARVELKQINRYVAGIVKDYYIDSIKGY